MGFAAEPPSNDERVDGGAAPRWRDWVARWKARRIWRPARRLEGARIDRGGIDAAYGGHPVRVDFASRGGRAISIRMGFEPPDDLFEASKPKAWVIEPQTLKVSDGPQAAGFTWVAWPLHALAAPADRCVVGPLTITYETGALRRTTQWLSDLLSALERVALNLSDRPAVDALLLRAADTEDPAVRLRGFQLQMARAEDPAARRRLAIRALWHRYPDVRLMGALEVGPLGLPTLEASVLSDRLSVRDRRRALDFMVDRFGDESLLDPLVGIAVDAPPPVAKAAVVAMQRMGAPDRVAQAWCRILIAERAAEDVRLCALDHLCTLPVEIAVPRLYALIDRARGPGLLVGLVGLGRIGERAEAVRLADWAGHRGPVGRAARAAQARILQRLHERRGALSVLRERRGELSQT